MDKTYQCSKVINTCEYGVTAIKQYSYCEYMYITGQRRGCDPEKCSKYARKTGKRRVSRSKTTLV